MNNQTTMTAYTSARTGITYGIQSKPSRRVVGFVDGAAVWAETPCWEVWVDGRMVQFSLTEDGILDAIARAEGVSDGIPSSRFD